MQKIAVLTSGGDAPGMNFCVVAVAKTAEFYGMPLVGMIRGYNSVSHYDPLLLDAFVRNARDVAAEDPESLSLVDALETAVSGKLGGAFPDFKPLFTKYRAALCLAADAQEFCQLFPSFKKKMLELDIDTVLDIADLPGTYLRTARCPQFLDPVVRLRATVYMVAMGIEGLVVIGGDGSFNGAKSLCQLGMPCIGIPGTIDNDIKYSEMTLGYDTAVNVCVTAVRQIRATSRSHDRPHVVEVMGNRCGDIALRTAVATGAEIVIVPEVPWSIEEVAAKLQKEIGRGNTRATVVIAEGAYQQMKPFDMYNFLMQRGKECLPGETINASRLASILKRMCHILKEDGTEDVVEVRATVLGYTQRGESPTEYDAAFAFEAGHLAVSLLLKGEENKVIGLRKGRIFSMPIEKALKMQKKSQDYFNYDLYTLVNSL